ncbi:hypothetical protein VPH35_013504 [Triticum aestivum]|uniref:Uncharacterized protein n=1 Tax=Aegilops tauschii subsp. strangulata TaxID=200361 RepID=A0A452Y1V9_AEGTS
MPRVGGMGPRGGGANGTRTGRGRVGPAEAAAAKPQALGNMCALLRQLLYLACPGPCQHLGDFAACDEPSDGRRPCCPSLAHRRGGDLEVHSPLMLHVPGVPHLVAEVRAAQHRHAVAHTLRRRVPPVLRAQLGHGRVPEHLFLRRLLNHDAARRRSNLSAAIRAAGWNTQRNDMPLPAMPHAVFIGSCVGMHARLLKLAYNTVVAGRASSHFRQPRSCRSRLLSVADAGENRWSGAAG